MHAVAAIAAGQLIIVVDDEDRENGKRPTEDPLGREERVR